MAKINLLVFLYEAHLLDIKHSNITRNLLSSCHGNIMEADNERDREGNNEGERINRL